MEEQGNISPLDPPFREPIYKRVFDLTVLVAAHITLAPLWLLLWAVIPLAIKLDDRGPIFYSQQRMGRDGKLFTVRKFRSMVIDAEKGTGAVWAGRNDPRITRVGRILRKTAMDELPQVLNVWKGEMSIVGPRPERPELHAKFVKETPAFERRLQVRPGMAGMAQVYGNYDSAPPEKLKYDLQYIDSMSMWLDVKLITLAVMNTVTARWGNAQGVAAGVPQSSGMAKSEVLRLGPSGAQGADEASESETRQAA